MKLLSSLLAISFASTVFAGEKMYLKGRYHDLSGSEELSFNLSLKQKEEISQLTNGKVDFRNIFVVQKPDEKSRIRLKGSLHQDYYEPPMLVTEYDPDTKRGWWQQAHRVQEAWQMATGKGITIADCDAGFYVKEKDIAGNLLMEFARDFSDTKNPTVIDDGNFASHGTAVAAIMVGLLDGSGINGISPDSKLIPLQNFNYDFNDTKDKEEATAECVLAAIKIPAVKIIVLENQTHGSSETFVGTREAVRLALKAGITIVSAAGNSQNELVAEEKDDTGSIIVGAVNQNGDAESFTNFGKRVSIAAYGSGLLTLEGPNGALGEFGGTSGATPQVASAVALMLEVNPKLTPEQIKAILISTRTTTEGNKAVGGLLNLVEAVKKAKETASHDVALKEALDLRAKLLTIL